MCLVFMKMSQTLSFLQVGLIFFKYNFLLQHFGLKYDQDVFLTERMRLTRGLRSTFTTHVHTHTLS